MSLSPKIMTATDDAPIASEPAPAPTAAPSEEDGLPTPRRYVAIAAVLVGIVLVVLDGSIANLALPIIEGALQVSPAASVWVVTGYQMAIVMFLLPAAAAGESLGYRPVFVAGVAVFTAASALCALAPSLPWLIAARFLQGLGSAALMSLALALLRFVYPRRLLGAAIGWNALTVALSSAAGPSIGAAILSVASWPWLFALNIPVGIVVLVASRRLPPTPGSARKIDMLSVALNAGAFGALVVGVDLVTRVPWLGGALLAASAISLGALVHREMAQTTPLIPLDLLRGHSFRISVIASICCFSGQMASYVALPFYIQHGLGLSAFKTGLYMTPWPLAVALMAPIAGRLSDRVSSGWLCTVGGICLAAGLACAAVWPLEGNAMPLLVFMVMGGLGFGFFQTPNNRNMLLSAPRDRSGAAGGMQGTARLLGQTIGAVTMTLLFTLTSDAAAPRIGLGVGAVLALLAGLVSVLRVPVRRRPLDERGAD
ncbi:MAG TPA: MFS transporter [Stellaceae bacterium]|nr:MFS transporter [Stellaceae bacterium]